MRLLSQNVNNSSTARWSPACSASGSVAWSRNRPTDSHCLTRLLWPYGVLSSVAFTASSISIEQGANEDSQPDRTPDNDNNKNNDEV